MRILICDDDPLFSEQLEHSITEYFRKHKLTLPDISVYDNGEALLSDSGDKDLVFLDVEMPGRSGIYVGNHLSEKNPDTIIFIITSFAEYLDDAMRFHVFRYLNKPLDKDRLYRNLADALREYASRSSKFLVETKDSAVTLSSSEIISVEAQNRTLTVHSTKGDYTSVHAMSYWQETLTDPCFFQCHRSYIINLSHVLQFNKDLIQLTDNQQAYLTRRKYTAFKKAYMLYLENTR